MAVAEQQALSDIAEVLYVDVAELGPEVRLDDLGMDSVRIMELLERWRSSGVADLDFPALAEDPHLSHWLGVLRRLQS